MLINKSYDQILRSSSIIGGANSVNYLLGIIQIKAAAMLLGPAGIGLIGLYKSVLTMLTTFSGFGINQSGVREVAKAISEDDTIKIAHTVFILRRICWITGTFGWLLTIVLAYPINQWIFESSNQAILIALLGSVILVRVISQGQMALLQGSRHIGDIAKINVVSMLLNTALSVGLYGWLGTSGIVPALIVSAIITLFFSWQYARRIEIDDCDLSWYETVEGAKRLVGIGLAVMVSGLLGAGLDVFVRAIITREYGIESTGLYQAAWALSGLFAGFVLRAMGMDFYPRLTGVIEDKKKAMQIVNEQTEIGVLLALPLLIFTILFSPWLLEILYSKEFLAGADLLVLFAAGIFGRVLAWPLGYVLLAKGESKLYLLIESVSIGVNVGLIVYLVPTYGIIGAGYTVLISYFLYTLVMMLIVNNVISYRWSREVLLLLASSTVLVLSSIVIYILSGGFARVTLSILLLLAVIVWTVNGIVVRLGGEHSIVQKIRKIPIIRHVTKI